MQVLNCALTGPRQIIATVEMRLTLEEDGVKSGKEWLFKSIIQLLLYVWQLLPHSTEIPEELQSFESAPPLITLSPFHQSVISIGMDIRGSI